MGFIYILTNRKNGKQYVGKTVKTIDERFVEYRNSSKLKNKRPINYAIAKYGFDNFAQYIEEHNVSEHDLLRIETEYIIKYNTLIPNGYNVCESGKSVNIEYLSKLGKQRYAFKRIGMPNWKKKYYEDVFKKYDYQSFELPDGIYYRRDNNFVELYDFIYRICRRYSKYDNELFEELANCALDLLDWFSGKNIDDYIIRDEILKNIRQEYERKKKYDPYYNYIDEEYYDDEEYDNEEHYENHLYGAYCQLEDIKKITKKRKEIIENDEMKIFNVGKEYCEELLKKVKKKNDERNKIDWRY